MLSFTYSKILLNFAPRKLNQIRVSMSNKIKENILIFWGSLVICIYIADSFGWIDIHQLLQQVSNYEYTYEETTRMVFPVLFTTLALIEIAKIIILSFQMGQTSIPTLPSNSRREVKLLPSIPLANISFVGANSDNDITNFNTAAPKDRLQEIRDRHLYERSILQQQILKAIRDYLFATLPPFMKDEDIETLYKNVELWQSSQEAPLSPTMTNGKLSTLDLRHLAWNIGERLKWPGETRAFFIKQSFPHEFRDSDISSIRRNLRQQGDSVINIDIPDKHDYRFHPSGV